MLGVIMGETRNKLLSDMLNENPTSFLEGRDFRAFHELNIAQGATLTFEVIIPSDVYIESIALNIDSGHVEYRSFAGGTPSGTFTEIDTIFNRNTRSDVPAYTRQLTAAIGGSVTGGVLTEVARVKTGTNNQRVSILEAAQTKRGTGAGTYYLTLENIGSSAVEGVFYVNWSEWP
jgi:hypothetical protein